MNFDVGEIIFYLLFIIPPMLSFILANVFNNVWFLINAIPNLAILFWAVFDKFNFSLMGSSNGKE